MARIAVPAALIVSVFCLMAAPRLAQADPRCDSPPYGDTPELHTMALSGLKNIATALAKHPELADQKIPAVIREACDAKYNGGDRSKFYLAGMTDHDFAIRPSEALAMQYLAIRMAQEDQKHRPRTSSAEENRASGATIYALFYCVNSSSPCEIHGDAHMGQGGIIEELPYPTLADCQRAAYMNSSGRKPDKEGRTMLDGGSWWECRGKHVETWNPAQ